MLDQAWRFAMKITEDRLIGWLCFARLNCGADPGEGVGVPADVIESWIARGWAKMEPAFADGDSAWELTRLGGDISDLHAADWGIDAMAQHGIVG